MAIGSDVAMIPQVADREPQMVRKDVVVLSRPEDYQEEIEEDGSDQIGTLVHIIESQNHSPAVGSVAISNSSDVHFGHRTFIHGPVTIKQFISENKQKDPYETKNGNCFENPSFSEDNCKVLRANGNSVVGIGAVDNVSEEPEFCDPGCFAKFNRWTPRPICTYLAIAAFVVVICTSLAFLVIYSQSSGGRKSASKEDNVLNIPIKTNISDTLLPNKHLRLIARAEWLAQPSEAVDALETPVPRVVITHTATNNCTDQASCTFQVRTMQTYHIESKHWSDIAYNFLVGGDGAVYEGRGWDNVGAHTKGYNVGSIGIAFIGTFNTIKPPERQLNAALNIINKGVELGKIAKDYKIFGHRQLIATLSPGDALFNIIKTWPHFSEEL